MALTGNDFANVSKAELKRFNDIKTACLSAGTSKVVSDEDKQWVLDLMKREKVAANSIDVLNKAKMQGFNVDGILVKV